MKPLVSVLTITYNHAPYIRRCIESILMQKTTFPFELVIGEDCSTDGTREIVLDYAKNYPDVIRIITSETNVGENANERRTGLACQGEFIAICEGDDYWIDPLKLQKQYDAIKKYDATLVTHGDISLIYKGSKIIRSDVTFAQDESGYLDIEDIILKNKNFATSSFFFPSNIYKSLPDWFHKAPIHDVPLKLILASLGKVYFINEIMSVWQRGVPGSWTERKDTQDVIWQNNFQKTYLEMYVGFDQFTESRYTKVIKRRIHSRLGYYYTKYGNLDFLEISERKKKTIRMIAAISRIAPGRLRYKITRKIVEKITPALFG